MELKILRDLVNYIGIYGTKTVSQMKQEDDSYRKIRFDELIANSMAIAAYLQNKKRLKKGGMVSIMSENRPEWIMAYFGIIYNGIWAVPLDARLTDREVKNLMLDSGAKIIFLSKATYENISAEPELAKHITEYILFDDDKNIAKKDKKVKLFSAVIAEGKKLKLKESKVVPEDVASLIYTSGTTGKPKGVMLTHKNFIAQVLTLQYAVEFGKEDTHLCLLPLHHTFEFSIELVMMYKGTATTYAESFKANKMLANIKETNVTLMIGIPLLFEKLYDGIMRKIRAMPGLIRWIIMSRFRSVVRKNKKAGNNAAGVNKFEFLRKKAGMDKIKFMISGAAPLNQKVAEGFAALGFHLINGYGLTESSPVVSVNRLEKKVINESVGILLNDVQAKILKPDFENNGEILLKSDCIMKGYYKNPKATKEVIDKNGWLHTGDIGTIMKLDGDTYLYITGRSKNMIVTPGGKNVYPEELEELIDNSELVLECLVIGVQQSKENKGESIYAYVVPNYEYIDSLEKMKGFKNTEEHIEEEIGKHIKAVNAQLKDYQKIRNYRIRREEFPKTATKKIKRFLFSGDDFINT